jgi:hypothetical protein
MIIFINTTLYNCSCDCCILILCRVFIVCVVLFTVFRLIVVLFCAMCGVCVLCFSVVPLPPGENPFAVKNKCHVLTLLLGHLQVYTIQALVTEINTISYCVHDRF